MQKTRAGKSVRSLQVRNAPPPEGLKKAFEAYSRADRAEAERLCRAVAASRPDLFDAWHLWASSSPGSARATKPYELCSGVGPSAGLRRGADEPRRGAA